MRNLSLKKWNLQMHNVLCTMDILADCPNRNANALIHQDSFARRNHATLKLINFSKQSQSVVLIISQKNIDLETQSAKDNDSFYLEKERKKIMLSRTENSLL